MKKRKKIYLLSLAGLIVLAAVLVFWWWLAIPRTAERQFEYARNYARRIEKKQASFGEEQRQKAWDAVIAAYEKVISNYPESELCPGALREIACVYSERLQHYDKAVAVWGKLIEQYPDSPFVPEALFQTAQILQKKITKEPHFIEAIEAYKKLIKDFPESEFAEKALYELGNIYCQIKEYELAIDVYQRFIDRYPDSELADDAQYKIASIYGDRLEKHRQARQAYEKLETSYPQSIYATAAAALKEKHGEAETEQEQEKYFSQYYKFKSYDFFQDWWERLKDRFRQIEAQQLDIISYDLDVEIPGQDNLLKAKVKVSFKCHRDDLSRMVFLLNGKLVLSSVEKDGEKLDFRQGEDTVQIVLTGPLARDAVNTLVFTYEGKLEDEGKIEEQSSSGNGCLLALYLWYPMGSIGDLFTAESMWRVPAKLTVVSAGLLSNISQEESYLRYTWKAEVPVFGLYCAYGQYKKVSLNRRGVELACYLLEQESVEGESLEEKGNSFLNETASIFDFYTECFGDYPFRKLAVAEADIMGGRGSPSLVLLTTKAFQIEEVPVSFLAHEIAHQWWGNLVPASSGEEYIPWLSEGFATYSDALYVENKLGRKAMVNHLRKMGHLYFDRVIYSPDEPIIDCRGYSPVYQAVVYQKGALILHALRFVVGDETFFRILKDYARESAFRPPTVNDFQKVSEKVFGQSLDWFFEQWLNKDGFPQYSLGEVTLSYQGNRYIVKAEVLQKGEIFRMPVEITLHTQGADIAERFLIDKETNLITMESDQKPVSIEIDKDNWILKHPEPEALIKIL